MPKIVCVNEKGKVYNTPEDLTKIVHYVFDPLKTTEDQVRPGDRGLYRMLSIYWPRVFEP